MAAKYLFKTKSKVKMQSVTNDLPLAGGLAPMCDYLCVKVLVEIVKDGLIKFYCSI